MVTKKMNKELFLSAFVQLQDNEGNLHSCRVLLNSGSYCSLKKNKKNFNFCVTTWIKENCNNTVLVIDTISDIISVFLINTSTSIISGGQ